MARKAIGGLTKREVEMLAFLRKYIGAHVYGPSYAEMCDALGYKSKAGPARILEQLEERALIERLEHRHRAITITAAGMAVRIPEAADV